MAEYDFCVKSERVKFQVKLVFESVDSVKLFVLLHEWASLNLLRAYIEEKKRERKNSFISA